MTHSLHLDICLVKSNRHTRCLQLTFVSDLHHDYCVNEMNKQNSKSKASVECKWKPVALSGVRATWELRWIGREVKDQHNHIHCYTQQKKPNFNSNSNWGTLFVWLSQTLITNIINKFRLWLKIFVNINTITNF